MVDEHEKQERTADSSESEEDERVLFALAVRAAEREDPIDLRHEQLACGDPRALAELEVEASASEEARRLLEIYRPIDQATKKRMAAMLGSRPQRSEAEGVRRRPARWMRRILPIAAVALLSIAILLRAPKPEPLPPYTLEIVGGQSTMRSSAEISGPIGLRPGSKIELVLRPEFPHRGSPIITAFIERSGERIELRGTWKVSENGAAKLDVKVDELFAETSEEIELMVVVEEGGEAANRRVLRVRLKKASIS